MWPWPSHLISLGHLSLGSADDDSCVGMRVGVQISCQLSTSASPNMGEIMKGEGDWGSHLQSID